MKLNIALVIFIQTSIIASRILLNQVKFYSYLYHRSLGSQRRMSLNKKSVKIVMGYLTAPKKVDHTIEVSLYISPQKIVLQNVITNIHI